MGFYHSHSSTGTPLTLDLISWGSSFTSKQRHYRIDQKCDHNIDLYNTLKQTDRNNTCSSASSDFQPIVGKKEESASLDNFGHFLSLCLV